MSGDEDRRLMRRALRLAVRGLRSCAPNPAVGCVIAKDGQILGEGFHRRAGEAHAEVLALAAAGTDACGATVYTTLEPCSHRGRTPACAPALAAAGIARVVAAMEDPNPRVAGGGFAALRAAGIEVETGIEAEKARRINRGFCSRFGRGRPWLTLKVAASLDGRSALADGTSRWITGEIARAAVQRERARAGAILTGVGTILADDPTLDVRLPGARRQPPRVVLDSAFRTPPAARLFTAGGAVHIFGVEGDSARRRGLEAAGAVLHAVGAAADGRPSLPAVLHELAALEVNDVYAECGPALAGALIVGDHVDELEVYFAPHLFGPAARPFAALEDAGAIPEQPRWRVISTQRAGRDARIRLRPERLPAE